MIVNFQQWLKCTKKKNDKRIRKYYEAKKQSKYIVTFENELKNVINNYINNNNSNKNTYNETKSIPFSSIQELEKLKIKATSLEKYNKRKDRQIDKLNEDMNKWKSKYENVKLDHENLKLEIAETMIQKISSEQTKKQITA